MVTTVTDNSPQSINTSLFAMDNEIQKVKKIAESFDEKLSGIDIETGVISVNGKQGVVELTADDVDALPSSTVIPTTTSELENTSGFITINDVGASFVPVTRKVNNKALSSDITLTASDVGALPNTTTIPTKTSQLTNDSGFITSSSSITGNAATATTADKVKNALTVNGKTYDGSSAVDAGVQKIENGGTGQTTQAGINKAFVGELEEAISDVTDGTMFVSSYATDNGFADTNAVNVPYKRKFSRVWGYIKGKISSVLGLTASNYGGKASTAGTADTATKAIQDGNGNVITSTYAKKGEVGVPQVVHFNTSNLAGSYKLVRFGYRSAFRCVISGTCGNYAEAKIIDVIASNASVPQSNTLGNTAIGSQGNFSFDGGDWTSSLMYWNKPLTEENVYYTVVFIPYSENNVNLVI